MAIRLSDRFGYRKLIRATIPPILMMVWISVYGVVDGLFVSNIVGASAFTAINLVMPVLMVIAAFGFMLGAGGSALTAKTLGEGKPQRANKIFSMTVYFTASLGVAVSVLVFIFLEPIIRYLGGSETTEETLRNALLYGRIFVAFETTYMVQNVFQSFFITAEKATLGFIVTALAGLTNILLDTLFVAVFRWGIAGAAVATGISQIVGVAIPIFYFSRENGGLLRLVWTKLEFLPLFKACTNGSSELLSNVAMSITGMLFNTQLLRFAGESGVAAYGVIMYAGFIFCAIFIGYTIGAAPIVGYHFGAENHDELKGLLKRSLSLIGVLSALILFSTEIFAGALSGIFLGSDPALKALTTRGFRIYGVSFALCGFNVFASGFFTALNDGLISAVISFSRTLVFPFAFVLLLPVWWGIDGVWASIIVAEVCSLAVSAICLIAKRTKYRYA